VRFDLPPNAPGTLMHLEWVALYGTTNSAHLNPPLITKPPNPQPILMGQRATLNVNAVGSEPLSYQWFSSPKGDTSRPIRGADTATLLTAVLTNSVSYWVRVSNPAGIADSDPAHIVVVSLSTLDLDIDQDGACILRITGTPGSRWQLQQSWDLKVWWRPVSGSDFVATIAANGESTLLLPSTVCSSCFYRLVWADP
jgi:hypothetical protein